MVLVVAGATKVEAEAEGLDPEEIVSAPPVVTEFLIHGAPLVLKFPALNAEHL